MEVTGTLQNVGYSLDGKMVVTLLVNEKNAVQSEYQKLMEKDKLAITIAPYRKKRSLDANAYMWQLCQKLAEKLGTTKEAVYKKAIRDVGQFEIIPIRNDAAERWIEIWRGKGLGWFAEVMDDSKLKGYKKVITYYGSSVYDSREMSVLVDYIVQECKDQEIETLPEHELAALCEVYNQ
jgi:hypothetical protein